MSKTEVVKVATPKGTKTSEVILGTASVKIAAGVKALTDMMTDITKLSNVINENVLIIADQEDKIATKALELKNAVAQNKIELQQAYDSDRGIFVQEWLEEKGYEMILKEDLQELRNELSETIQGMEEKIRKEISSATGAISRQHESDKKLAEAEYKAKEANNLAEIAQLKAQNAFLTTQVNEWKEAAAASRQASVDIAKAGSIQNLNLGSGNGK